MAATGIRAGKAKLLRAEQGAGEDKVSFGNETI